MKKNSVGVLLAGGESRRFGSPKAFAHFQGEPFYSYSLQALRTHSEEILIISHPSLTSQFKQNQYAEVLEDMDPYKGCGPLAGLYTAMVNNKGIWYVTAPCDTPNIHSDIYKHLWKYTKADEIDAIVPIVRGKRQPLLALYQRSCLPKIKELLDNQIFKVGALFEHVNTRFVENHYFDEHAHFFHNVNDAGEQRQLEENSR